MKTKTWLLHGSKNGNYVEYEETVTIIGDPSYEEIIKWEEHINSLGYTYFEYMEER